ncbi:RidA family protein [Mesorhizobium sp. M0622]|uniref:RidA family protein n=1 Tax=unclassified Mesorhizobium TaxID=325217 RepID=UPI003337FCE3
MVEHPVPIVLIVVAIRCKEPVVRGRSIDMSRTIISGDDLPKAPPVFSHAVKCAGLVFVSGTAAYDATGMIVGETIQEQTAQALRNITAILKAAGTTLDKAVSATVILADEDDFPGMNEEWVKWFPTDPPARQGAKLPVRMPRLKVSIAMIAEA